MWPFKPKPEQPKQQGLMIRFDRGKGSATYTYTVPPGSDIWKHSITRDFLKWYFCRPQSQSFLITNEDGNTMEWTRRHIINIEIQKDVNAEC